MASRWLVGISFFLCLFLVSQAISDCDLGAADLIYLVKASHLMSREDFQNAKGLMKNFGETLDIGRDNTTTHVGVVFFDNIGPPQTRIPLSAYSRLSDLQMGIDNLSLLPCGSSWCKEKETSFRPALDYAMSRFPKGRMKKIVLIHSGREEPSIAGDISDLTAKDPWLRILHIFMKGNIVMTDEKDATYLTGYHEPYKRYVNRMGQLFPNISIPIPETSLPIRVPKDVEPGKITVGSSENLLKLNDEICQQLFTCPPCAGIIGGRDPFDKETPLHNKLPSNWKIHPSATTRKKINSGTTDDYEYEITGDPPGLTINNNPALKNLKNREVAPSSKSAESVDYVYEDSVPDSRGMKKKLKKRKRSKRAVLSPRQRDCTCQGPLSFSRDTPGEENVKQQPAEGCSGSSATGEAAAQTAGGCGGGGDHVAASPAAYPPAVQYYPYYQQATPQYAQYMPQYYQQYAQQQQYGSPCRMGASPCQRPFYYQQPSPCNMRSPCMAQYSQYQPHPQYPAYNYGYYYPQTAQPQQTQIQATEAYVLPATVQSNLDSSIYDSAASGKSSKTQVKPAKTSAEAIFEKLAKYEKDIEQDQRPMDPFNVKAFGGSQLKRIPSEGSGFLENIITPAPPEFDSILGKFPAPMEEEMEATIPARPVTLKPVDIGSELLEIDARKRKRQRRTVTWGEHPWHQHWYNHFNQQQPAFNHHPWLQQQIEHPRAHVAPLFSSVSVPIPLTTTEYPTVTTEEENQMPCSIFGMDMVVYIDDVAEMSPSEFNTARIYVKQIWRMMNTDPNDCHEMSRLAVVKTSPSGEVVVQAELDDSQLHMPKDAILDYMEYSGSCPGRRKAFSCEQALPRALIMASNLLSMSQNDREKLVIVISSRPSTSLGRIFESLIDARDYLANIKASLIFVAVREGSGDAVGLISNLHNILEDVCSNAPSQEKLAAMKKFCPWMAVPIMDRANSSTYQIYG